LPEIPEENASFAQRAAQGAAVDVEIRPDPPAVSDPIDPDLALLIDHWRALPYATKAAILALLG
jgi:hypothetical protein